MTARKLIGAFAIALVLQGTVFAWQYRDLLYLHKAPAAIEHEGRDVFIRNAISALSRDALTRKHLDTIVDGAVRFKTPAIEIRALIRRSELDPHDVQVKMRLADALRFAGHLAAAERLYDEVIALNSRRR